MRYLERSLIAKYSVFGAAAAASVASTAELLMSITNPAASTMAKAKLYEWSIGPGAAAEDSNYTVSIVRVTAIGTVTTVTASPVDSGQGAAITIGSRAQTAGSNTKGVTLGSWGFNQRGGIRWVAVPGGELVVPGTFLNGLALIYTVVQGTAVNYPQIWFDE